MASWQAFLQTEVSEERSQQNMSRDLEALPSGDRFEQSYVHSDVVSHVAVSPAGVIISGDNDGHLKIWKKQPRGIELAKDSRAHQGPIEGLAVSVDGLLGASISSDQSVKIYDVVSYDMMNMLRLSFTPGVIEFVYKPGDVKKLAISDRNTPYVHIYVARAGTNEPLISEKIFSKPVTVMKYNPVYDTVICAADALIAYRSPETLKFPRRWVEFKPVSSYTDIFKTRDRKTTVSCIEVSPDGQQFSVTSPDRRIRIFWYRTGKLRQVYDESLWVAQDLQRSDSPFYRLDAIDFRRRLRVEREIDERENAPQANAVFDESSNFIIYATLFGIKVVNLKTNEVVRILGKLETTMRFLRIIPPAAVAANANESNEPLTDPTLLCCAFKKDGLYIFSKGRDEQGRWSSKDM